MPVFRGTQIARRPFSPARAAVRAALLFALGGAAQGCLHGQPHRPDEGNGRGPGSSANDPILVSRFDDEVRYIQRQACPEGGHPVVGDDSPLFSGERRCFLDRIQGSCASTSRAWYFLLCE